MVFRFSIVSLVRGETPTPATGFADASQAAAAAVAGSTSLPLAPVSWVGEKIGSCHYAAAQFAGRVYHVSDTVLLQSSTSQPYVCRIERMLERNGKKKMCVRWFFRPHDVQEVTQRLNRQAYVQELFLTDIVEENDLSTIFSRCYIISPRKYAQLPPHLYEPNVFCCSLFLNTSTSKIQSLSSISSLRLNSLYTEPPLRAPRLNRPLIPLSGAVIPGFNRAVQSLNKKKQRRNSATISANSVLICSVENCPNICWQKQPVSKLEFQWSCKSQGAFVCAHHISLDEKLSLKRSRSLNGSPNASDDESDTRKPLKSRIRIRYDYLGAFFCNSSFVINLLLYHRCRSLFISHSIAIIFIFFYQPSIHSISIFPSFFLPLKLCRRYYVSNDSLSSLPIYISFSLFSLLSFL